LDRLLREGVASGVAPGIVAAIADRSGVVYEGAAGRSSSSERREMRPDAVFRIASMTKPVTSLAILMLVEAGEIDLDRAFADYVPAYRQPEVLQSFDAATGAFTTTPAGRPITIRQLLTHTSGYGYWFMDAPLLALTKGAPELFDPPFLMHPPGTKFSYSVSTDVLGQIVEPVGRMPLEAFFRQRIFDPLGMNDTSYAPPRDPARLTNVHARAGEAFDERANEAMGSPARGGGGLYSTAADYVALLRLFLNEGETGGRRLIGAEQIRAMTRNQIGDLFAERQTTALPARTNDFIFLDGTQKFGFGVTVETRAQPSGRPAGSYGWAGIYNTYFWVDPLAGFGAVLLMQTSPFSDSASIEFYRRFESAVYGQAGGAV
jgi:CubicO group peptidase (beta-lactamase class C family)